MFAYANMTKAFLVILALSSSSSPSLRHPREGGDLCTSFQRMFAYANMTKAFLVIPAEAGISLHL